MVTIPIEDKTDTADDDNMTQAPKTKRSVKVCHAALFFVFYFPADWLGRAGESH